MIDAIRDLVTWRVTGWYGLTLYWLPLAFCLAAYTVRCWSEIHRDLLARGVDEEARSSGARVLVSYIPTVTVGTVVGRLFLSVVPFANLFAAVFDVAPRVFGRLIDWLTRTLDAPLVRALPRSKP